MYADDLSGVTLNICKMRMQPILSLLGIYANYMTKSKTSTDKSYKILTSKNLKEVFEEIILLQQKLGTQLTSYY